MTDTLVTVGDATSPTRPEVSVVMPCLNEAETVAACVAQALEAFARLGLDGEVVVADNGSSDGSRACARRAGARVVNVSERGYGAAIRGGVEAARGTYVIVGDADRSYDFGAIGPFVERLRDGADLVMGNRFRGRIAPGAMPPLHRWLGNPVLSWLGRLFFGSRAGDFHCGLRAVRVSAWPVLDLRTTGMELASEMVIKSALLGLRVEEVPVSLDRDGRSRPPHLRTWRDGWRHLRFMLLFSPFWLFGLPGLLLFLGGLFGTLWLAPAARRVGALELDIHTMLVASALCLAGQQLLVFGAFTKAFAVSERLHPPPRPPAWLVRLPWASRLPWLEIGLIAGALGIVAGTGWLVAAVLGWRAAGFGHLDPRMTMRQVIPATLTLMLGIQTVFASFFLGVLGLRRR